MESTVLRKTGFIAHPDLHDADVPRSVVLSSDPVEMGSKDAPSCRRTSNVYIRPSKSFSVIATGKLAQRFRIYPILSEVKDKWPPDFHTIA